MELLRRWRRQKLHRQGFPAAWRQILHDNVPLCRQLPEEQQRRFERQVRVFLDEKHFEGCGGLTVTEEMRVTVAGYACLLLLGGAGDDYPQLGTIVLYPESFATPVRTTDHTGIVTETIEERLGESWQEGTIVLAWDSIRELLRGQSGDCNVIIHEFAHQVDARHGLTAGAPLLTSREGCHTWAELWQTEQYRQRTSQRRGRPAALDPYAFTSPEELFAVASETFFMRSIRFRSNHPELYAELRAVYGVDPAEWILSAEG